MVRREISLDEESDRLLSDLAEKYQGDHGRALADLLQAQEMIESFVDQCEEAQRDLLLAQKERSEKSFKKGRSTAWEDIKRRNDL